MDEYAGGDARSSFGGTECNAYDTLRDPGGSSGGSAVAVGANFVTCAIGEETGGSILKPARFASTVAMPPTRELVSAKGMIQRGISTRVGPICRTVEDTARILDAYAGFRSADELTAFSVGRLPKDPYYTYAKATATGRHTHRRGARVYGQGSVHARRRGEHRSRRRGIETLRALGATIVDPGPHGALLQSCVDRYVPKVAKPAIHYAERRTVPEGRRRHADERSH
jgi:Asp-tRNA(Asn)/Glu-tRNA(Gln) amidotransferase A subunit family amidase